MLEDGLYCRSFGREAAAGARQLTPLGVTSWQTIGRGVVRGNFAEASIITRRGGIDPISYASYAADDINRIECVDHCDACSSIGKIGLAYENAAACKSRFSWHTAWLTSVGVKTGLCSDLLDTVSDHGRHLYLFEFRSSDNCKCLRN